MIVNLVKTLSSYGIEVKGICFDGDKCQVKNFVPEFYDTMVNKMRLKTHEFIIIEVYKGLMC